MQSRKTVTEGVIKYRLEFVEAVVQVGDIRLLNAWRSILHGMGWLGQDPGRYSGYGYGNVSQRLDARQSSFLISASQTGGLPVLDASGYTVVESAEFDQMRVQASGRLKPSSEALSHAMIYRQDAAIGSVLHVHEPRMWHYALAQGYPASDPRVGYGSAQMVREVERLYRQSKLARIGVLVMAGHEDGIIAFGEDTNQAGLRLLKLYLQAV